MMSKRKFAFFILTVLMLVTAGNTMAVTTRFLDTTSDGNWFTGGNWDNGIPTSADEAYINGGHTANINVNGAVANNLYFGLSGSPGHLTVGTNGVLAITSKLRIGADPASVTNTMTMNGGTVTTVSTQLGNNVNCTGVLTMNSSSASLSSTSAIAVGISGTGDIQMVDGTLGTNGQFVLGYNSAGTGTMTMSDGVVTASTFELGYNGAGTLYMNGGSITTGYFDVGRYDTGIGHLQLDGGVINASNNFRMRLRTSTGTADITKGILKIDGDKTSAINTYATNGWLTGHDGFDPGWAYDGSFGDLRWDYDTVNPGKTTVWAVPEPSTIALVGFSLLFVQRCRKRR